VSKAGIVILVVLVAGVLGFFGYKNHERNEQIRSEAYADGNNMLRAVLPQGEQLEYARGLYDHVFSDAFGHAFSGGLFSQASYDEAVFLREATRLISIRARSDGQEEVALAVEQYVDR